jgi:N-acetyl-anhydromuramyl-L-alanine amidase AmpD
MEIVNLVDKLEWHPTRRWSIRQLSQIKKIIIHQELGEGSIENVNKYHIGPNHISSKGCPRICYHYGIRKNGEIAQLNELSSMVWHTKGQNREGIGILVVGNFAGTGHTAASSEPTNEQLASLAFLVDYLKQAFDFSNQELFGHYHFGKPACPGFVISEWIEKQRNELFEDQPNLVQIEKTVMEIQKHLHSLGYDTGKIDGIQGVKTLAAIRKFQADQHLLADGIVGPNTWKHLLALSS